MNEIRLVIKELTPENRREKFTAAVNSLAKSMQLPLTIKPRERAAGEKFVFQAHADLVAKWNVYVGDVLDDVYLTVCRALDLPVVKTFSKAVFDKEFRPVSGAVWYNGKLLYNPETGRPLYRSDFEKIIRALERFLNRKLGDADKKIVLNAVSLGRILARRLEASPTAEVRKLGLSELEYKGRDFPWISESLDRQDKLFGPARPEERERMKAYYGRVAGLVEVAEQSMGDYITRMEDDVVHAVRRTIIDGVKARKSKTEVAQDLFNRFGDLNRDWQRISETETVEAANNAMLRETVAMAEPGAKVYFRRVEMRDQFVCKHCEAARGAVVLWVDHPMADDAIDDPVAKVAIWDGKNNVGRKSGDWWLSAGTQHPWCRGSWERYFPPASKN